MEETRKMNGIICRFVGFGEFSRSYKGNDDLTDNPVLVSPVRSEREEMKRRWPNAIVIDVDEYRKGYEWCVVLDLPGRAVYLEMTADRSDQHIINGYGTIVFRGTVLVAKNEYSAIRQALSVMRPDERSLPDNDETLRRLRRRLEDRIRKDKDALRASIKAVFGE